MMKKAGSKKGSKAKRAGSKKGSKMMKKAGSKKESKMMKKAGSKKGSKMMKKAGSKKGSKAKRSAPAHSAIQTEVIKMIAEKENTNYPGGMKKLKEYLKKALGNPYVKGGDIPYIDALQKVKDMLKK